MTRLILVTLLLAGSSADAESRSSVEVQGVAPPGNDRCLDHTVRELGMSAKQVPGERVWNVQPQFLHAGVLVPDGTVQIRLTGSDKEGRVTLYTTWVGGVKPKEQQAEVEQRMVAMASMMTVACGALPSAKVQCTVTPAGGKARPCEHAP